MHSTPERLLQLQRQWVGHMREAWNQVYVGIDHHSAQITVAAGSGAEFQERLQKGTAWLGTRMFAQDGLGYRDLLTWLAERFPGAPRERFVFLAEPTFSKPLYHFLAGQGFVHEKLLWVRPFELPSYRKAKGGGKVGKNDIEDARVMARMAFESVAAPHERRELLLPAPLDQRAEALGGLARDHQVLTRRSTALKNQIADLAFRLFPECRRVWYRTERIRKPDGTIVELRPLSLFAGELPLRILDEYPSPRAIAEAGVEQLCKEFCKPGVYRRTIAEIVRLAEVSGGADNPFEARRLPLLIQELREVQEGLQANQAAIQELCDADPVLASFGRIHCLGPQAIATIVGALGDVSRFRDFDAVKRYLNVAPVGLPQTGKVDAEGNPVQFFRFPANTYKKVHSRIQVTYLHRGRKDVRDVGYSWFNVLTLNARANPDDRFVQLYQRLKKDHAGTHRWYAKIRWKVVAKLIEVVYHCLKKGQPYDPDRKKPAKAA